MEWNAPHAIVWAGRFLKVCAGLELGEADCTFRVRNDVSRRAGLALGVSHVAPGAVCHWQGDRGRCY